MHLSKENADMLFSSVKGRTKHTLEVHKHDFSTLILA